VGGTVWAYEPPVATANVHPDRMVPPVMLDDTRARATSRRHDDGAKRPIALPFERN
jgi:hypothetical protein